MSQICAASIFNDVTGIPGKILFIRKHLDIFNLSTD